MVIPVGVKAAVGTELTFRAATENLPPDLRVYLEDKLTSTFTKLDATTNNTTTLSSDSDGIGRFYLHTTSRVLSKENVELSNVSLYTYDKKNLRIAGIHESASIRVYNILGAKMLDRSFEGTGLNMIVLGSLKTGLYIVTISTSKKGTFNKKVIIK